MTINVSFLDSQMHCSLLGPSDPTLESERFVQIDPPSKSLIKKLCMISPL